jgi:hypothetical protein
MGNLLDEIYDAERLLCKGMREINQKDMLDRDSLEMLSELVDAAKDVYEIEMRAEHPEYSHGYSRNDYSMRGDYGNQSYAARRDSMGRYSRTGRRGYSRDSVHDEMIAMLEQKMNAAPNEQEREMYRRKIMEMDAM